MAFEQVIPFDVNKGGNVPDFCLDNVRRGYSIANKYSTAWEAWEHTQQHLDRNIPVGLDVPLYYSYTTTIKGVTQNYGHINVRLKNGTVWSDGNIYTSIDDYMSKKFPKFVGWGESVNDFKIIEGVDTMPNITEGYLAVLTQAYFMRDPLPEEITRYVDKADAYRVMDDFNPSNERKQVVATYNKGLASTAIPLNPGTYIVS